MEQNDSYCENKKFPWHVQNPSIEKQYLKWEYVLFSESVYYKGVSLNLLEMQEQFMWISQQILI